MRFLVMFRKPITVKSHSPLGNAEKKRLRNKLIASYHLKDEELDFVLAKDKKTEYYVLKVTTSKGMTFNVIKDDKNPLLFETKDGLIIPTLYALYKSCFIPFVATPKGVLPKLCDGAGKLISSRSHDSWTDSS